MFERYSFVAITALDLDRARAFWVNTLGFTITEEAVGQFFIVDAGVYDCVLILPMVRFTNRAERIRP